MPTQGTFKPKNLFTLLFGHKEDWSPFEKIWFLGFTAINIALFFILKDTILGLITSLSGMLCVVLAAKGKISTYFFGLIQTTLYGYVAFSHGLYGETMLNWAFYAPLQLVGFFLWVKAAKSRKENVNSTADIPVKTLTLKAQLALVALAVVSIIAYAFLLQTLGGQSVGLDSATNVLSVIAQFLMLARYVEQWLLWIVVNVLSVIMWTGVTLTQGAESAPMIVMWSAFLINAIYGYRNWKRLAKVEVK